MDRGAWWDIVHGGHKELDTPEWDKLTISVCTQAVKYKQEKYNFPFVINLLEVPMLSSSVPSGNDIIHICKQRSKSVY